MNLFSKCTYISPYFARVWFYKTDRFTAVHLAVSSLNESNLKHRRLLSTTTDDQPGLCCAPRASRASVEMWRFLSSSSSACKTHNLLAE